MEPKKNDTHMEEGSEINEMDESVLATSKDAATIEVYDSHRL